MKSCNLELARWLASCPGVNVLAEDNVRIRQHNGLASHGSLAIVIIAQAGANALHDAAEAGDLELCKCLIIECGLPPHKALTLVC